MINFVNKKTYVLKITTTLFAILMIFFVSYMVEHSMCECKFGFGITPVFAEDAPEDNEDAENSEEAGEQVPTEEDLEAKKKQEAAVSENMKFVLNGLEDKRKRLQEWEERLNSKNKKLEELKSETEEKIVNNTALLKKIEDAIARFDAKKSKKKLQEEKAYEAELAKLVKLYSGMKAQKAAAIINNLNMEVTKAVFSRMKGDKAAKILSFVNSERAARISERLAAKKR